jgi:predicted nuclease of predicted toxin-antitoxin system
VKFLVDNQLPTALARFLTEAGHPSFHVLDIRLDEAQDEVIWTYSQAHDFVLVSKDEDFLHLANRINETGKLLWVRIGNCRKLVLLERFQAQLPRIIQAFVDGYRIIEVR